MRSASYKALEDCLDALDACSKNNSTAFGSPGGASCWQTKDSLLNESSITMTINTIAIGVKK